MAWNAVIGDLGGRAVAFPIEWELLELTSRLGSYMDIKLDLESTDPSAGSIEIGSRTIRIYSDTDLRFNGQVWEPLEIGPQKLSVVARDPYARMPWRRVRTPKTYTGIDAGLIAQDRVAIQNGYEPTFLKPDGLCDPSVVRTIDAQVGQREDEIIEQLGNMSSGFFFAVKPRDDLLNPVYLGELVVRYPNAGVTREEVRFEFGSDTRDNLEDYTVSYGLPLNRYTAASLGTAGGRISKVAEAGGAPTSIQKYGLFEDESVYSEITDLVLLQAVSEGSLRPEPPRTYTLAPSSNAPLLFKDFDVGDFVRLRIKDVVLDLFVWVRVVTATLAVDRSGNERLSAITVEEVSGSRTGVPVEDLYRVLLDNQRSRLEALERRVSTLNSTSSAGAAAPVAGGSGSGGTSPPPTGDPPPPPPPAPPAAPTLGGLSGNGVNYMDGGTLRRGIDASVSFDCQGSSGTLSITAGGVSVPFSVTGSGSRSIFVSLSPGTYSVFALLTTSSGDAAIGPINVTVPSVTVS